MLGTLAVCFDDSLYFRGSTYLCLLRQAPSSLDELYYIHIIGKSQ